MLSFRRKQFGVTLLWQLNFPHDGYLTAMADGNRCNTSSGKKYSIAYTVFWFGLAVNHHSSVVKLPCVSIVMWNHLSESVAANTSLVNPSCSTPNIALEGTSFSTNDNATLCGLRPTIRNGATAALYRIVRCRISLSIAQSPVITFLPFTLPPVTVGQ